MPEDTFEGVEKRLVLTFAPPGEEFFACPSGDSTRDAGLRAVAAERWTTVLMHARCTVLSTTSDDHLDSFVLSESSMFVYPGCVVLKTCGTTTLLQTVAPLLDVAALCGLEPRSVCFSRMNYTFPADQTFPHTSFADETAFLDETFHGGRAHILGSLAAERYHYYHAGLSAPEAPLSAVLEIQMFDLDPDAMAVFFRGAEGRSGREMTEQSGIDKLLPGSIIDEYAFDPCGYSMNGLIGGAYWTIHITPEDECSYVSFETNARHDSDAVGPGGYDALVARVLAVFRPTRFAATVLDPDVSGDARRAAKRCGADPGVRARAAEDVGCLRRTSVDSDGECAAAIVAATTAAAAANDSGSNTSIVASVDQPPLMMQCSAMLVPGHGGLTHAVYTAPRDAVAVAVTGDDVFSPVSASASVSAAASATSALRPPLPALVKNGRNGTPPHSPSGALGAAAGDAAAAATNAAATNAAAGSGAAGGTSDGAAGDGGGNDDDAVRAAPLSGPADWASAAASAAAHPGSWNERESLAHHALVRSLQDVAHPGAGDAPDSFFVVDMGVIVRQLALWRSELPGVVPHYGVQCNADPRILSLLARFGASFDCASQSEMDAVLALGVSPSRVVYANPCRLVAHLRHARDVGVDLLVADGSEELAKIAREHPASRVLVRIQVHPERKNGAKYGASPAEVTSMLREARDLGLDIAGVAFHVGWGSVTERPFVAAIRRARAVFDEALEMGFRPRILDIGDGFPGRCRTDATCPSGLCPSITFVELAATIRPLLDDLFGGGGVRIIAEPGRFLVSGSHALAARVVGKRAGLEEPVRPGRPAPIDEGIVSPTLPGSPAECPPADPSDGSSLSSNGSSDDAADAAAGPGKGTAPRDPHAIYFLADGIFGGLSCTLHNSSRVEPRKLPRQRQQPQEQQPEQDGPGSGDLTPSNNKGCIATLLGPTRGGLDTICENTWVPDLDVGDYVYFKTLGAFSSARHCTPGNDIFYIDTEASSSPPP